MRDITSNLQLPKSLHRRIPQQLLYELQQGDTRLSARGARGLLPFVLFLLQYTLLSLDGRRREIVVNLDVLVGFVAIVAFIKDI